MKIISAIFEDREIRRIYDEKTEIWFFSVVDIVQILTQQPDYKAARNYWKDLKNRLAKEGSQLVTNCNQLKLPAADGKMKLLTNLIHQEWSGVSVKAHKDLKGLETQNLRDHMTAS